MFDNQTEAEIVKLAGDAGIAPAVLLAIAEVESGGKAYALVGEKREPLIRFEGHYFDRRLTGIKQQQARAAGLAANRAGAVRNPSAQAERWAMLRRAASIDHGAAHESVSWGLGQVMGAHWRWLGFASVDALVEECRGSVGGQVRLMLRYCEKAGLFPAIRAQNWAAFARGYNGPSYAANGYDTKLAAAFARHQTRRRQIVAQAAAPASAVQKPAAAATPAPSKPQPVLPALFHWLRRRSDLSSA